MIKTEEIDGIESLRTPDFSLVSGPVKNSNNTRKLHSLKSENHVTVKPKTNCHITYLRADNNSNIWKFGNNAKKSTKKYLSTKKDQQKKDMKIMRWKK